MSRFRRAIKTLIFGVVPAAVLTATATGVVIGAHGAGRNAGAEKAAASCSKLTELTLPETTIGVAEVVPIGEFTPPGSSSALDLPSFCRVAAMTTPAVHFEVWLPINDWNGKFQGVGNAEWRG